ncbi:hypothetical protein SCACP_27560 [Sporomusa carbonis]|uniref:DUF4363 family protein n=1 Tax=Sporomusa carbonis TaxID=3076075 RepID=UPI003A67E75E
MLYNTNKQLKLSAGSFYLLKRIILTIFLCGILVISCSCTLLTKSFDSRTGFSKHLAQVENSIRNEDWEQAKLDVEESKTAWKKIKPFMQVDIDHDYIKDIEDGFIELDGYLDTKDKSNSLVSILLIENTWENIDSL